MRQQVQSDFDQHWRINPLSQVSDSKLREAEIFFRPVVGLLRTLPVRILDVGCGDGIHWRYLQSLENGRLGCAGVDISAVALRHMQRQCVGEQGHLIQMDATALALLNDAYDIVFAFGVVAYTSDQQRCFAELCRVCKPGGWIGVWIYPQQEGLGGLTFGFVRRVCQRVGPFWTRRIADLIVPFLGILPTRSKMSLRNSTWRQCREVVLVNIAPKQLAFFCRDEVVAWFVAHGIDIEYEDRDNPITIWGRKQR